MPFTRLRRIALAAAIAAALPGTAGAQAPATFLGYRTTVPSGWVSAPSTSTMRLAQYTIAPRGTTAGADVVVYFFGKGQGGDVGANLARWKSQFSTPDGSPVYEQVSHVPEAHFPITVAEYRGTYARGTGAGDAAAARPGQSLIAAIVETPNGTLFVQLYGPTASVTAQRSALLLFVSSLR
jgi:hypothetical protein